MIAIRRSSERGAADHGWLDTRYTFSFSDYYDPQHMNFRSLRVMNEDKVAPAMGFPMHGHRDMEIITFVLEGQLEHHDNMENQSIIRPGEIQRMSAGTGIRHSEFNPSDSEPVHLYQIWIMPDRTGHTPTYEQTTIPVEERAGKLKLAASNDGRDGSVTIHQDAAIYWSNLESGQAVKHELAAGRHAWVQVMRGGVKLNGETLEVGDGAAVSEESALQIVADGPSELLVFDLG